MDGTNVSNLNGFIARGKVSSLGPNTIWILDYDGGYTVDQQAMVVGDKWSAVDKPLGDSTDELPFNLTMVAVIGDQGCTTKLADIVDNKDGYTEGLPVGCKTFAKVTVRVSIP